MKYQAICLTLLVGLTLGGFQNCSGTHDVNEGGLADLSSSSDPGGEAAFYNGFYQFTQTKGCVNCHGVNQNPMFALPDVNAAYSNFLGLVNANDPASSIIITYSGNSHCHAAPCEDTSNPAAVANMIGSWAAAETGAPVGPVTTTPNYTTATVALPATIPLLSAATPGVVRFNLANLNIPALAKATMEVEVQYTNNLMLELRFNKPKIGGSTAVVSIKGIHIFIKPASQASGIGLEDVNTGMNWATTTYSVPVKALPAPLPAGPMTTLTSLSTTANEYGLPATGSYMITIGFDTIQ